MSNRIAIIGLVSNQKVEAHSTLGAFSTQGFSVSFGTFHFVVPKLGLLALILRVACSRSCRSSRPKCLLDAGLVCVPAWLTGLKR